MSVIKKFKIEKYQCEISQINIFNSLINIFDISVS